MLKNIRNWQMLDVFQSVRCYVAGMPEREWRRMRWIATCRLDSLNVTKHTRIGLVNFEGGLGPTS